jgi:hypothetical protein
MTWEEILAANAATAEMVSAFYATYADDDVRRDEAIAKVLAMHRDVTGYAHPLA